MTEEVLTVGPVSLGNERLLIGILQKHRTHQRQSRARGFLYAGVDIRQQAIALFDVAFADRFLCGAVYPRFLIRASLFGVVAIDRIERSQLKPLSQQVGLRTALISADVGSHNGKPTDA